MKPDLKKPLRPNPLHEPEPGEAIKKAGGGKGFLAYTLARNKKGGFMQERGFNPMYPDWHTTPGGKKTFMMKKGLHQDLELHMLTHPKERLPKKAYVEKYSKYASITKDGILDIARNIAKHHNLPARQSGGPNFRFAKMQEIVGRFYANAKPGSEVPVRELIKQIGRESKRLPWPTAIAGFVKRLEKAAGRKKKNLKINQAGVKGRRGLEKIAGELLREGISSGVKRRRGAGS